MAELIQETPVKKPAILFLAEKKPRKTQSEQSAGSSSKSNTHGSVKKQGKVAEGSSEIDLDRGEGGCGAITNQDSTTAATKKECKPRKKREKKTERKEVEAAMVSDALD